MGFCRYCGDLVLKDRCGKCGGYAVAASFSWNPGKTNAESTDRWKKTYTVEKPTKATPTEPATQRERSTSTPAAATNNKSGITFPAPVTPVRRFSRPALNNRISAHISATTSTTERSPLTSRQLADTLNSSPSGNPILDDGVTLSKVYGSVLQSPESLASYACAECGSIFTRDATLYPDPTDLSRMLCRPCFMGAGASDGEGVGPGVKGECAACKKPVVMLRSEGGFVENSGRLWHSKCFVCDGCFKNIADRASVDLYGRPCCTECFDTSLSRPLRSSVSGNANGKLSKSNSPSKEDLDGGRRRSMGKVEDDSKATMDELSRKLGIQSKETTPSKPPVVDLTTPVSKRSSIIEDRIASSNLADLSERLRTTSFGTTSSRTSLDRDDGVTPRSRRTSASRFPKPANYVSSIRASPDHKARRISLQQSMSTPDLTSDVSDGAESSWPSPPTPKGDATASNSVPASSSTVVEDAEAVCDECHKPLYSIVGGGRIVTAPSESGFPGRYHSTCFICNSCRKPFSEKDGVAAFVVTDNGLVHPQCAPLPKPTIVTRQRPLSIAPIVRPDPPAPKPAAPRPVSALGNAPPQTPVSATPFTFNSKRCAGCDRTVAVMEPGVVPGPNGSRWHSSCLVCGGKGHKKRAGEPGCGKKLDRDAKLDREGRTWCSTCMTLLILNGSITSAPTRTPVSATYTGNSWVSSQHTGSSASVAPQSTGTSTSTAHEQRPGSVTPTNNSAMDTLTRRAAGAMSPTMGMMGGVPVNRTLSARRAARPRPKSVSFLPSFGLASRPTARMGLLQEHTGTSTADSIGSRYTAED